MRKGPAGPLECLVGAETWSWGMVGPWQYQYTGIWEGEGYYPPRYTHPPAPTPVPTRRTPRAQRRCCAGPRASGTCTYDQFGSVQGDPRGRIRTATPGYRSTRCCMCCVAAGPTLRTCPGWARVGAQGRVSGITLSYISVISQLYLRYPYS